MELPLTGWEWREGYVGAAIDRLGVEGGWDTLEQPLTGCEWREGDVGADIDRL